MSGSCYSQLALLFRMLFSLGTGVCLCNMLHMPDPYPGYLTDTQKRPINHKHLEETFKTAVPHTLKLGAFLQTFNLRVMVM